MIFFASLTRKSEPNLYTIKQNNNLKNTEHKKLFTNNAAMYLLVLQK